jgi:hypothetical protein
VEEQGRRGRRLERWENEEQSNRDLKQVIRKQVKRKNPKAEL